MFPLEQQEKGRLDYHSQSESKDASVLLDENGDELELTRAMSRNVMIPEGMMDVQSLLHGIVYHSNGTLYNFE